MSKHTPGPWKAQCPTYNEWHVYSQHHPSGVVTYLRGEFLNETAKANAALIAAAPDLLEALKPFLQLEDKDAGIDSGDAKIELLRACPEFIAYLSAARDAIAKAQPINAD